MYLLKLGPNARVYKLCFINCHTPQNSMTVGVKAAVGQGGFLREIGKARGAEDYLIFRMIIKADTGTINFSYAAAIRIQSTDTRAEIRVFAPVFPSIQSVRLWV